MRSMLRVVTAEPVSCAEEPGSCAEGPVSCAGEPASCAVAQDPGSFAVAEEPASYLRGRGRDGELEVLLDVAEEAVARIGEQALASRVGDEELIASVEALHRLGTRLEAEKLRRIAEIDARGAHAAAGARTTGELLAGRLRLSRREAQTSRDTAVALSDLPQVAAGLADGSLGIGHAEVAAATLKDVSRSEDEGEVEVARRELDALVAAVGGCGDRIALRREVEAWAHRRSRTDGLGERDRREHANRHLFIGVTKDGRPLIQGRADRAGLATLSTAVDALAVRKDSADERSLGQRRMDALVVLAQRALAADDLPHQAGTRAQVLLLTNAGAMHDRPGAEPSQLDGAGAVSNATARQICCDAEVITVSVGSGGEVLNAGRTRREPTKLQRAAVTARDQRCIGCGASAAHCQIHHVAWWYRDSGRTDAANLVLACWSCHHGIHHYGWQVLRQADGRFAIDRVPRGSGGAEPIRHTA